jgi:outer membrane lipoprotein SlyB
MRIDPLIAGPAVSVMILSLIGVGVVTGLVPGGTPPKSGDARPADPGSAALRPSSCALCGTVESIRIIELRDEARGAGAGGVSGAPGKQTDAGNDNAVTTIFGAFAGAITGDETERNVKKRYAYRVTVRMDDGSFRTVSLSGPPDLNVGDKVRVVEGKLVRT